MKVFKFSLSGLCLLAAFFFIVACGDGGEGSADKTEAPAKVETGHEGHDHSGHDHAGHDHSGHDHSGHDHGSNDGLDAATTAASHAGKGVAYESAYVCPMHCEGSGSDKAGKCPACKMDYVALAEHTNDGHSH